MILCFEDSFIVETLLFWTLSFFKTFLGETS